MNARTPLAVVLAAGKGTRMRSARAKVLHRALGLPLIELALRAVESVGADPVVVVVGYQAEAVRSACGNRRLDFVVQDPPLGTGHALLACRDRLAAVREATLLVLNGDLPLLRGATLKRLCEAHRQTGATATLLTADLDDPGAYGRVVRDPKGRVRAVVEVRDATAEQRAIREVNVGVYVMEAVPLLSCLDRLTPQNAQGEYYLTDVVELLASDAHEVGALAVDDASETWGVNTLAELAQASGLLRERKLAELTAQGVIIEDPRTTEIGLDVEVEADAVIRPFTLIQGMSRIRSGAQVGPWAHLIDVEVGGEAEILDHCLLRQCVVGPGASVGPFAHIRPESVIGAKSKVGNFVELKKTRLGDGSKAPHLSYVGDATVGPGVNIGAGTITCNYDGRVKHPTHIEAGAFIGSNSTLVAPVTVGSGAYVAAGSVVTRDVPEDALALGRARQVVKEGWARKRRETLRKD